MRIDAHQHFWHYSADAYGWIGEGMGALKRDFLPSDLKPLLESNGFDGCVAVQARQTLEETRWLLELADAHDFIKGVVGWVDLRSPGVRVQLEAFADHPRLCGIRHVVQDEPDNSFMLREDFQRGIAALIKMDLTYDVLIVARQLPAAVALIEAFPDGRFVLDHIAKPDMRAGALSPWSENIRRLAAFPNVACKVSGMVTEAEWENWQPADFRPYLDVVFDAFGPERLMIGSDWPVCTLAGAYGEVMGIALDYVSALGSDARARILGGTATAFYKLKE